MWDLSYNMVIRLEIYEDWISLIFLAVVYTQFCQFNEKFNCDFKILNLTLHITVLLHLRAPFQLTFFSKRKLIPSSYAMYELLETHRPHIQHPPINRCLCHCILSVQHSLQISNFKLPLSMLGGYKSWLLGAMGWPWH